MGCEGGQGGGRRTLFDSILRDGQRQLVLPRGQQARGLLRRELEEAKLEGLNEVVPPAVRKERLDCGCGQERDARAGGALDGQAQLEGGGQNLLLLGVLFEVLATP